MRACHMKTILIIRTLSNTHTHMHIRVYMYTRLSAQRKLLRPFYEERTVVLDCLLFLLSLLLLSSLFFYL